MNYFIRIAICLLVLQTANAIAQNPPEKDEEALLLLYGSEEMISIATGSRQPITKAPAVATVITAEDIRAIGAKDLDEVLETIPGLHVVRDAQGYNSIYAIRGIFSRFNPQVSLLINGIPLTNLFQGNRHQVWAGMPVEAIARIEVIRGPGSAIYGADAFAGVINIITKTRQDIQGTELGVSAGSFDTQYAWGLHGDTWWGFDVAIALEYHGTDGQRESIDADAQTTFDNIFGTNASLAPGPVNLQRENFDARLDIARGDWRLRAGLQRRNNVGTGAGIAQALDPNGRFASDRWNTDLTYHNPEFAKDWDVMAQTSFLYTSQEVERNVRLFPPGTKLPIGSDGNINFVNPVDLVTFSDGLIGNPEVFERHFRLDFSTFYTGFQRHLLRVGTGFHHGDLFKVEETKNFGLDPRTGQPLPLLPGPPALVDVSDTPFVFLQEDNRKNYYLFLQDEWNFANDWELTAGVRYDHFSDFGDTINPRLALVWSTRYDLTSKFLYGRAFRAPSFAETRNINNPAFLGNPNLDPETIETVELAFDYRPADRLHLALNLFHYWWDDIIRFVPDPGETTSTAQNSGEQTGFGLELEADWKPSNIFRLLGNYAYQQSTDEATGEDAGNAPHHQVYLRAQWEFLPNWRLNPEVNWIIDRERPPGDNRSDIDDYSVVDLTLRRSSLRDHWEIALAVRNLFDSEAREPSPTGDPVALIPNDLPLAGRSFFGEFRYHW